VCCVWSRTARTTLTHVPEKPWHATHPCLLRWPVQGACSVCMHAHPANC
jgi:hypothetical protein